MSSKLEVPFICQFIAMRWSYEELVVAQAKLNPLARLQQRADGELKAITRDPVLRHDQAQRLDDLKQILAILSGLEGNSAAQIDQYLQLIGQILDGKRPFDRSMFDDAVGPVTAERLYVNQKISDLISNAEMEQKDYRRGSHLNVFFGDEKKYFGVKVSVLVFNTAVLVLSTIGLLGLLLFILRRQLEVRRSKIL
jgi:hypothetical protein